jgi:hypothetical protein
MTQKSPASGKRQGLDKDFDDQDSSTNSHKLHAGHNGKKTLERIARKTTLRHLQQWQHCWEYPNE